MALFLQQTLTGVSVGLVYATVAMGLMLLLRAAGVMNFAQGNLLAMGAYIAFLFIEKLQLSSGVLMDFGCTGNLHVGWLCVLRRVLFAL